MHPPIEPFESRALERSDGVRLHFEISGSADGKAALYLHGGPGGGLGAGGYRRIFDPSKFRIIGLDQRGCGQSAPWAIDELGTVDGNTTAALIDDIEALREHLHIEQWLLYGVSWGSTLALAYALAHPDRVSAIVLLAVTSGSREEIDWITDDVGRIFPEAWAKLAALAEPGERVIEAYARMLRSSSAAVRHRAGEEWDVWESTHVSLDPLWKPGPHRATARDRENFATLVTHYWANDCFLSGPDRILDRVGELAGIPGVLIHGRRDVSGPASTAWQLHQAWPGSRLHIVEDEGHGGPKMAELASIAVDAFGS